MDIKKEENKSIKNKILLAKLVYLTLCNVPVCFFLCVASSISGVTDIAKGVITISLNKIIWLNFLYNFIVSFIVAMTIGMFVPLTDIGRWFTSLFKVDNKTYTHNMPYRLLATLIITCIYYAGITPISTIFNVFILKSMTLQQSFISWIINIPLMLLVGFVSSLISDIAAYKIAHSIDSNF